MKIITPAQYAALEPKEQFTFRPEYIGFKKKKIRDYAVCDCCGHSDFIGWREISTPIGEPLSYKKWKPELTDWVNYDMARSLARAYDTSINSALGHDVVYDGETIDIPFLARGIKK